MSVVGIQVGWIAVFLFFLGFSKDSVALDNHQLTYSSLVSPNLLSQFLKAQGRFPGLPMTAKPVPSPLTWGLGVGYSLMTSPAQGPDLSVSKDVFSALMLIGLDFKPRFGVDLEIDYDRIPDEAYSHGQALFRFEYLFNINKKFSKISNEDRISESSDAFEYYQNERFKKLMDLEKLRRQMIRGTDDEEEEEQSIEKSFPQLKLIYFLGFNLHQIQAKSVRLASKSQIPSIGGKLYQYQYGPEFVYSPQPESSYHLRVIYFTYSQDVDNFISQIDLVDVARYPNSPAQGVSALANQLLAFPSWSLGLEGKWVLNTKTRLELILEQTSYSSKTQSATYGISPFYSRQLWDRWNMRLGSSFLLGIDFIRISGLFSLNYNF